MVVVQQSVRDYPEPFDINAAHLLGYLSPITDDELTAAELGGDTSVNGASVVGRAGVEKEYDAWLRGQPGYERVKVNANGEVIGEEADVQAQPGDTLVTSIDAKVQGVVERQLHQMIMTARGTVDPVTGRPYEADSGAAVVMDVNTGRIVAMASQPTYDPEVWADGITQKQLRRLYSEAAGTPLLGRAMQGQFAPGSTWKPFMTAGALTHGYGTDTRSELLLGVHRRQPRLQELRVRRLRLHLVRRCAPGLLQHLLLPDRLRLLAAFGSDVADVDAKDPLVEQALDFGFGSATGIDIPGESSGRIADRKWKRDYYRSMKDYYCGIADKPQDAKTSDFVYKFAREFCIEGYAYRAGDAVNFAIGQGDTIVTPLQLARAYAAIANGGTLWEPRVGKAIVSPDGEVIRRIPPSKARHGRRPGFGADLHRRGAPGGLPDRHAGLEARRLPARRRRAPRQDRLCGGLRQAVDGMGRVLHRRLRRRDDDQPGRHRVRLDR